MVPGLLKVNFAFTILNLAHSASGNHTVATMKVSETYDELINGLQDICREAKD